MVTVISWQLPRPRSFSTLFYQSLSVFIEDNGRDGPWIRHFLQVTNWPCFPGNAFSCHPCLAALQKISMCAISPSTSLLKLNARPPAEPVTLLCAQSAPQMHTLLRLLSPTSHPSEKSLLSPCDWVQVCSLPVAHHVSPTGSDLGRTWAALRVMNHHFIFLSHMWVKLFDINHTLAAPVWNRRAVCLPSVAGCCASLSRVSRLEMTPCLWLTFPDRFSWMWTSVYFGPIPTIQSLLPVPTRDKTHNLQNKGMVQMEVITWSAYSGPSTTHSFPLLSSPHFFFPPSLKPRMQCLFKKCIGWWNFPRLGMLEEGLSGKGKSTY